MESTLDSAVEEDDGESLETCSNTANFEFEGNDGVEYDPEDAEIFDKKREAEIAMAIKGVERSIYPLQFHIYEVHYGKPVPEEIRVSFHMHGQK